MGTSRISVGTWVLAVALATTGVACSSSDDGAAKETSTTADASGTATSTVTLNEDVAARLGKEEGDEITIETAPTTILEETTTTTPATDSASDQFADSVLETTGLAEAEGEDDFASYTTFQIPGGYTADGPEEWMSTSANEGGGIVLNIDSFNQYSSGLQVIAQVGTPEEALESRVVKNRYESICEIQGDPMPYDNGRVAGVSRTFGDCSTGSGVGGATVIAVTVDGDADDNSVLVDATVAEPRDARALARVLATLSRTA